MFERFKTYKQLQWADLCKIETPLFARRILTDYHIERGIRSWELRELYEALNGTSAGAAPSDQRQIAKALLVELEKGRLFYLREKPLQPLLQWREDKDLPNGGRWQVRDHINSNFTFLHHRIDTMLLLDRQRLRRETADTEPEASAKAAPAVTPDATQTIALEALVEVVERSGWGIIAGATATYSSDDLPKHGERTNTDGVFRQYVNLDKNISGKDQRRPDSDRFVEFRAKIKWASSDTNKSLAGKRVYFSCALTKHSSSKRPDSLNGDQNHGFNRVNGPKEIEVTTDAKGWTPVVRFYLTQYAGDRFAISAQADENDSGVASGVKLQAGPYAVWRKFWYQLTHATWKTISTPTKSIAAYKKLAAEMAAGDANTFGKTDVTNADRTFYPSWMVVPGSNSAADEVVIGGHNRAWFYKRFKADATQPVKGHLIICDHQWDPAGKTDKQRFILSARSEDISFKLKDWNCGILKPALTGSLVVEGKWSASRDGKVLKEGSLTDTNILVNKNRPSLATVTIELPAECPDPASHKVVVDLALSVGQYFAGESNGNQMLIVYASGEDKEFNQV
ncbi:MAG: hypothetical protein OEW08_14815, partial [Gammaproteobacteria bacterium]|nr:hypothetical protein [Gammaproteobacteria bacterium]